MKAASLLFPTEATRDPTRDAAADSRPSPAWPVAVLGIPLANVSCGAALQTMAEMIAARQPYRISTANLDTLLQAQADQELRRDLLDSDMVLCDSRLLVAASWLLGNPLPEAVSHPALLSRLCALAAGRRYRLFLIDAEPGAASAARVYLEQAYPGITVAGTYSVPPSEPLDGDELSRWIRESRPDIILANFGVRAHSRWLAANHYTLAVPVYVELSTPLKTALQLRSTWPTQSTAAWAAAQFRRQWDALGQQFRRAGGCLPAVLRQWWRSPHWSRGRAAVATVRLANGWVEVEAPDELTRASCDQDQDFWQRHRGAPAHCALITSNVRRIDATGLAVLANCRTLLARAGRQLVLVDPSPAMRQALAEAKLAPHFATAASLAEARKLAPAPVAVAQLGLTRSLAWCGEIIASNVDDVWQMTSEYIRTFSASGATLVLIDLARLRYADSAGAGLMIRVKKWAREFKTEVIFTRAQPPVLASLQFTHLDRLLLEGAQ